MKTTNAIKKLEGLGRTVVKQKWGEYTAEWNGMVLSFYDSHGEITAPHTKSKKDVTDSMTDYFPGSFWDNLSQAIKIGMA